MAMIPVENALFSSPGDEELQIMLQREHLLDPSILRDLTPEEVAEFCGRHQLTLGQKKRLQQLIKVAQCEELSIRSTVTRVAQAQQEVIAKCIESRTDYRLVGIPVLSYSTFGRDDIKDIMKGSQKQLKDIINQLK